MKDDKKEETKFSRSKFGHFLILPTLTNDKKGVELFNAFMGNKAGSEIDQQYLKDGVIWLNEIALKQIKENYEQKNGRELVHVYAANSLKACLKPSELGRQDREGGHAHYTQGWQFDDNEKKTPRSLPSDWINAVGIPTVVDPNSSPQPPSKDEITHYIANLYFLLAQGKSIMIPVRPRNWYQNRDKNIPFNVPDMADFNSPVLLRDKNSYPHYEYSFGGPNAPSFFKSMDPQAPSSGETYFEFLEKELNKLNDVANQLEKLARNNAEVALKIIPINSPPEYAAAFKAGLTSNEECWDHTKYRDFYLKPQKTETKTKLTSSNPIWKILKGDEFRLSLTKNNRSMDRVDKGHYQLYAKDNKEKTTVDMKKLGSGHIELSTKDPNPETYQIMVDAMAFAEVKEVEISVSGYTNEAEKYEALDQLWLKTRKAGLSVKNHVPREEFIKRNKEAQDLLESIGQKQTPQASEKGKLNEKQGMEAANHQPKNKSDTMEGEDSEDTMEEGKDTDNEQSLRGKKSKKSSGPPSSTM